MEESVCWLFLRDARSIDFTFVTSRGWRSNLELVSTRLSGFGCGGDAADGFQRVRFALRTAQDSLSLSVIPSVFCDS
jgi:hypothetical protein